MHSLVVVSLDNFMLGGDHTVLIHEISCCRYEMTPDKIPKPSTFENYDITDLNSGDETDDDEAPRKKIPEWALGKFCGSKLVF